jgi:RHS repeat-associated protein
VLQRTLTGKRTYTWTSFGQLKQLVYESAPELRDLTGFIRYAAGRVQSEFDFDAAGGRARQVKERIAPNDAREIETTLYLGAYERENHTTKTNELASPVLVKTVHRHSLGGGMSYTRVLGGSSPGTKLTNVIADHLGSTDALVVGTWNGSTFANQSIEYQSFDAWGERRDAATQISYRASDADPFRTSSKDHDRGYTGHEQLDDSGLIHMNGRIFDPELGRFLSPDPVVQIPEYSQNFNRYSYCLNNPLNATDPSGFSFISKAFSKIGSFIKENWRTIVVIVVVAVAAWAASAYLSGLGGMFTTTGAVGGQLSATGMAVSGGFAGAIGGGLGPALNGGDIGDVLRGAVVGGIQGAISGGILHGLTPANTGFNMATAQHVAGHGIVGGAANEAMGGKFQDGFLSAAASAGAGDFGLLGDPNSTGASATASRTIRASVMGGTTSALGGGKFANGAYTAAFQHLLNVEAGNIESSMGNNLKQVGKCALDLIGKAWNLPNTAFGLAWGGVGLVSEIILAPFKKWDFKVSFGYNAIQFEGHPLMLFGAITLGNTIHYPPSSYNFGPQIVGFHEIRHTYQGQILGPLYLPANISGMTSSLLLGKGTHNGNFMESFGAPAPWPSIHKH